MFRVLPKFYLAHGEAGPGQGLVETDRGQPAVVLFTRRDVADAFFAGQSLAEPWEIHATRLYTFARWLDEHRNRGVRDAVIDPDPDAQSGTWIDTYDLITELER